MNEIASNITIPFLLGIIKSANIAPIIDDENKWWTNVEFIGLNGWKVIVFYDGNEMDYIDSFISPDGMEIDFWEWPENTNGKNELINYRIH